MSCFYDRLFWRIHFRFSIYLVKPIPAIDKNDNFISHETESFASEIKGGEVRFGPVQFDGCKRHVYDLQLADAGTSHIPQLELGKLNAQDVHRLETESNQASIDEGNIHIFDICFLIF